MTFSARPFSSSGPLAALGGILLWSQHAALAQSSNVAPPVSEMTQGMTGTAIFPLIACTYMVGTFVVGMYVMFTRKARQSPQVALSNNAYGNERPSIKIS